MANIFVSYSHSDRRFIGLMQRFLVSHGRSTWVDWKDIEPTAEWWDEICNGIDEADTFVFVISPESLQSHYCLRELERATSRQKNIVSVIARDVKETDLPDGLKALQWVDFSGETLTIDEFFHLVDRDRESTRVHAWILKRAETWVDRERDPGILLRGIELLEAESWLTSFVDKPHRKPRPTDLQRAFIHSSRELANTELGEAQKREEAARRAQRDAEDLLRRVLFDIRELLEATGQTAALRQLHTVVDAYFESRGTLMSLEMVRLKVVHEEQKVELALSESNLDQALSHIEAALAEIRRQRKGDPHGAEWVQQEWQMLLRMAAVHRSRGDMNKALAFASESEAIAKRLMLSDPIDVGQQRNLASSHDAVADLLRDQGDLVSALKTYQHSLAIREKLAAADPSNSEWQRDLSVSFDRVGDVFRAQGDLDAALKAFKNSLAIAEKLAAADPSNSSWQRDLSVSFNKLGDVFSAQGDLDATLKAFKHSLAIREKLAVADPSNSSWQRDLSVSFNKLGDVFSAQGDLDTALKTFKNSLAIAEKLAAVDPSNSSWQRDLSVSYDSVGDMFSAQGDLASALKAYQNSLAIREKLAAADPSNSSWQRDLSVSLNRVGDVFNSQGNLASALKAYQNSLAIAEKLAAADPSNSSWQRDLSVSQSRIGDLFSAQGDFNRALRAYRSSLAIVERLSAADPSNAAWQRDISVNYSRIGDVLYAQGDMFAALAASRESLVVAEHLAAADPSNTLWQQDVLVSLGRIGDILKVKGDSQEALAAYQRVLGIVEKEFPLNQQSRQLLDRIRKRIAELAPASHRNDSEQSAALDGDSATLHPRQ